MERAHVEIDEAAKVVVTRFPDGAELVAIPVYEPEHEARAAALGYTGDDPVWQMTREHDATHQLVAEARGMPYSPTLWCVATGRPVDKQVADDEERLVFLVQRVANQGLDALMQRSGDVGP